MRNKIATYKESLSRIANGVMDVDDDEIEEVLGSRTCQQDSPFSERRLSSRSLSQSASLGGSPISNGDDSGSRSEVDRQRAEIERLQASEAEIKAMAINYASLLKEKEGQLSRLNNENISLRKTFEARDESSATIKNGSVTSKKSANQSSIKQQKRAVDRRIVGNGAQKHNISKHDIISNGSAQSSDVGFQPNIVKEPACFPVNDMDHQGIFEVKNNDALLDARANFESEIKQLKMQLEKECENSANLKQRFQDAHELNDTSRNEIHRMKLENERCSNEMKELVKKIEIQNTEIAQLQLQISRSKTHENLDDFLLNLKTANAELENENAKLKAEKEKLQVTMESNKNNAGYSSANSPEFSVKDSSDVDQKKIQFVLSIQKLEKSLQDTQEERDKAQRELARLKQHLLDKELEESDKMDEDSKVIEELRAKTEHQKNHIYQLEIALRHELSKQEETRNNQTEELQNLNEINNELKQKLANCTKLMDSKNMELLNLQTALGQYYAESEAKERLEENLSFARQESANLSEMLKAAKLELEKYDKDKEELVSKLSNTETMLSDTKRMVLKLQEDNSKLHRAVEQSMTRINRMSMDSDYYVDRRIVIKLLVTFFQRNYSKEVLDLMVRMLGFSDEDKRRIGLAQQASGKTAVSGVLGLPGRLVGGILGGRSSEVSPVDMQSETQSFSDLWVDFLLKDAEQREKQEQQPEEDAVSSSHEIPSSSSRNDPSTSFPDTYSYPNQYSSPLRKPSSSEGDYEFANVPLTSSVSLESGNNSRLSRLLLPK